MLLDHMRKWMAIRSQVLDTAVIEQLVAKSHSRLRPPWGFGSDEKPRGARWLIIVAPSRRASTLHDMHLIVRGGQGRPGDHVHVVAESARPALLPRS